MESSEDAKNSELFSPRSALGIRATATRAQTARVVHCRIAII